ncbi:MAG: MurR/RpiR family transcriptional regulator [Acidobacteria bacterium]|nr:MurR/RpiR family transcriptional regulator [Acidobacteriota bacterium]
MPAMNRAQRQIAEIVLKDPEQFISCPVSQLASMCRVSKGSIVLFCKALGLKGLSAFKLSLARELAAPVLPFFHEKLDGVGGSAQIVKRVFEEHVESLRQTMKLNPPDLLASVGEALGKARHIVLFSTGLSYPMAYSLHARLRFMGLPAFMECDSHLQLAAAAQMGKQDVAVGISVSGCTTQTVECLWQSKSRGAKTIAITNCIGSPLTQTADVSLYAAPGEVKYFQAPLASRLGQLALVDALLVIVGLHRKRQALAHLRRHDECLLTRRISDIRALRQTRKATR